MLERLFVIVMLALYVSLVYVQSSVAKPVQILEVIKFWGNFHFSFLECD